VLLKQIRAVAISCSMVWGLVDSTPAAQGGNPSSSPVQSAVPAGGGGSTGLPTTRRIVDQRSRDNPIQPPLGGGA